jgi:hypothetical protein
MVLHACKRGAGECIPHHKAGVMRACGSTQTTSEGKRKPSDTSTHGTTARDMAPTAVPETRRRPSDENAKHVMASVWPPVENSRTISPVPESTNCIVPSEQPNAMTGAPAQTQQRQHNDCTRRYTQVHAGSATRLRCLTPHLVTTPLFALPR